MMQNTHVLAAGPLDHQDSTLDNGQVTLQDTSRLSRVGFRGRHAVWYLQQRGFSLPDQPNQACWQSDGSLVARLSQTEYLLLAASPESQLRIQHEEQQWQMSELSCFVLPRQDTHAWLMLNGTVLSEVMAKLCAVDLSPQHFTAGAIAQTSVARANAIVINASQGENAQFWLLMDYSMAPYFWSVLRDASAEFAMAS
ncbi:sarcosine oxidase subunit gamma [Pantoea dispersa]|uniref:sarcosine oxidase subunit gamma n=1 Tax=Pantoea dispersa TaxID=59814 RepID=UPI0039BE535D